MSHNPKTRFKLGVKAKEIKYIAKNTEMTYEQVLGVIQQVLTEVLNSVESDLIEWIRTKVPKRTGQLRDSLIKNLRSSRMRKGLLRIIIGSHLNYINDLNQMSTSQVRHNGEIGYAYYYGHYSRIVLNDPQAVGGFWDKLLSYAKSRVNYHLKRTKQKYIGSGGLSKSSMSEVKIHD